MGPVLTEVLPWIVASLIVGFIVGWLFWRGRYSRFQVQIEEKLQQARSLARTHEGRANELSKVVDRHRSEVARLSAHVDALEDKNSELSAAAHQAEAFRARIGELQTENEQLSKRTTRAESTKAGTRAPDDRQKRGTNEPARDED